jgi:hypothetical protein
VLKMPGGDKTGPEGKGTGTGWGRGGCVTSKKDGEFAGYGRGLGRGRGFGRRRGRGLGRFMPWNWFNDNEPQIKIKG